MEGDKRNAPRKAILRRNRGPGMVLLLPGSTWPNIRLGCHHARHTLIGRMSLVQLTMPILPLISSNYLGESKQVPSVHPRLVVSKVFRALESREETLNNWMSSSIPRRSATVEPQALSRHARSGSRRNRHNASSVILGHWLMVPIVCKTTVYVDRSFTFQPMDPTGITISMKNIVIQPYTYHQRFNRDIVHRKLSSCW